MLILININLWKSILLVHLLVMYEVLLLGYLPGIVTSKNMEV